MGKYVVIIVVALWATHLLLSRTRDSKNRTAAGKALHRGIESTLRKIAIVAGGFIAALVVVLLVKHLTS